MFGEVAGMPTPRPTGVHVPDASLAIAGVAIVAVFVIVVAFRRLTRH
jgi:hypothetical protein